MTQKSGLKRYNLVLPEAVFDEVRQVAASQNTTVVEMLRRYIKLGLMVSKLQETPEITLSVKEKEIEREIILL